MEHRVFGAPQTGVDYWVRPGAYGVAFDDAGRAGMVFVHFADSSAYILLGGGIEPGEGEADCIRREIMGEIGYSVTVGEKVCVGEEYTFTRTRQGQVPFHPIGHIYLVELGEKMAQGEPGRELVWLPVEECRDKMVSDYQSWAVELAWELYQKRQKERRT